MVKARVESYRLKPCFVEHLVGLLDRERVGGAAPLSAAGFNAQVEQLVATDQLEARRAFSDAQLTAVRKRIEMLQIEWAAVAPGSYFELSFDRASLAP